MPANPELGEVEFEARGKLWTMSYSLGTLRALEKQFKCDLGAIFEQLKAPEKLSAERLSVLFWYGLRAHNKDIKQEDADSLVTPKRVTELVGEAFALAFGAGEDESAENPPAPEETSDGIGLRSSGDGAA